MFFNYLDNDWRGFRSFSTSLFLLIEIGFPGNEMMCQLCLLGCCWRQARFVCVSFLYFIMWHFPFLCCHSFEYGNRKDPLGCIGKDKSARVWLIILAMVIINQRRKLLRNQTSFCLPLSFFSLFSSSSPHLSLSFSHFPSLPIIVSGSHSFYLPMLRYSFATHFH